MPKILWINPVGADDFDKPIKEALDEIKQPQTQVDVVSLKRGPRHLEYRYYEALVIPETLHLIKQAEKDGYDATVKNTASKRRRFLKLNSGSWKNNTVLKDYGTNKEEELWQKM